MLGCRPEIAIDGPRRVMTIMFCDMSASENSNELPFVLGIATKRCAGRGESGSQVREHSFSREARPLRTRLATL